ncbi:MAG: hypothetical protein Q9M91_08835 [Candidatus Dojkabacteria bacterium]|nr:hypothetical protein [Candidatus Dojkabacteria bacterium]MDQ7021878.1 hypothetical protein [Candidatus Dojkabacteria bacterium]
MSSKEREILISLSSLLLVGLPYIVSVFITYQDKNLSNDEELKFWATAILIMIPLRIVSMIVMYILVAIATAIATGKESDFKEIVDERDKLIDLKGERNGQAVFLIGFGLALVSAAIGQSLAVMFSIIVVFGVLSEVIGSLSKICYYRGKLKA